MKFICEVCGKRHTNITDASECEKACKAKLEESLAKEKEQEDRFKAIGEMVNAYNKDYMDKFDGSLCRGLIIHIIGCILLFHRL